MSDGSTFEHTTLDTTNTNLDLENESRALRILEIMNDFRTLQVHITSLVTSSEANPPNQEAYNLDAYVLLRQCKAEAEPILAMKYNAGSLGFDPSKQPDTEDQKATLQR